MSSRGARITAAAGALALLAAGGALTWWMQARPGPLTVGESRPSERRKGVATCTDPAVLEERRQAMTDFGMPLRRPKPGPLTELSTFEVGGLAGRWLSMPHPVFEGEPVFVLELMKLGLQGPAPLRVTADRSEAELAARAGAVGLLVVGRDGRTREPIARQPTDRLRDPRRQLAHAELRRQGSSIEAWDAVALGAAMDAARAGRLSVAVAPDDVVLRARGLVGAAALAAIADPGDAPLHVWEVAVAGATCLPDAGCWSAARRQAAVDCGGRRVVVGPSIPVRGQGELANPSLAPRGLDLPLPPVSLADRSVPRPREPWRLPMLPSAGQVRLPLGEVAVAPPPLPPGAGRSWLQLGRLPLESLVRSPALLTAVPREPERPGHGSAQAAPFGGPPFLWGNGDGSTDLGVEVAWVSAQIADARRVGRGPWGVAAGGAEGVVALHAALRGAVEGPVVLVGAPVTLVWPDGGGAAGIDEGWLVATNRYRVTRPRGAVADPWIAAKLLEDRVIWVDPRQADGSPWTRPVPGVLAADLDEAWALAEARWPGGAGDSPADPR